MTVLIRVCKITSQFLFGQNFNRTGLTKRQSRSSQSFRNGRLRKSDVTGAPELDEAKQNKHINTTMREGEAPRKMVNGLVHKRNHFKRAKIIFKAVFMIGNTISKRLRRYNENSIKD